MYLYHGTPADFDVPTLNKCKPHRDFGCGFYLAINYFDALPMAVKNSRVGYVQTYLLTDLDGLSVLEFDERSEDWLRFVVSSRLGTAPNADSHRPNISSVISGYKQPSKSAQSIEITGFIEKSKPPEIIFFYTLLPLTA